MIYGSEAIFSGQNLKQEQMEMGKIKQRKNKKKRKSSWWIFWLVGGRLVRREKWRRKGSCWLLLDGDCGDGVVAGWRLGVWFELVVGDGFMEV